VLQAFGWFAPACPDALLLVDAGGSVLAASDRALRMLGAVGAPHEVCGRFLAHFLCLEEAQGVARGLISGTSELGPVDVLVQRGDGVNSLTEITRTPLGGTAGYAQLTLRDCAEGSRANASALARALHSSEERFAKIFHRISSMLAFTEPDRGRIVDVNDAWVRATGYTREFAIGRTGSELGLWADPQDREHILRELQRVGRVLDYEAQLKLGEHLLPVLLSVEFVPLSGGSYILWEIRDESARKRAESEREKLRAQLFQSQKMESIGSLAGGVAHDFNNLLTVINGCSFLLMRSLDKADKQWALAADIQQAGERAAGLTQQLLAFSRKQVMKPRALDLNALVSGTGHLLRRLIGEHIDFRLLLDPNLDRICADPTLINQVLINLVVNARDAMSAGGRLTVETKNLRIEPTPPGEASKALPGPYVRISVSDTGVGMDDATMQRVFEPFFTTKPRGKGSGLGLSMVYGIVEQSGGFVSVSSELGSGSCFEVYLPPLDDATSTESVERQRDTLEPGTETILVVEDQVELRRLVLFILEGLGYRVLSAGGAEEALQALSDHGGPVHLLLTDVVMPGMSGRSLGDQLRALHPGIKVLFMTGYADAALVGASLDDTDFLQKPFTPAELGQRVRAALKQ
jgi:two-component system cell cycle sensor histidine kinase/response regulator CckA